MNNKWVCYAIYGEDSGYSYSDLSDIDKEKLQNYLTYETKKQNEILQCLKKDDNNNYDGTMIFSGDN